MPEIIRRRNCNKENNFDPLTNATKRICIPINQEEYTRIFSDPKAFRESLDKIIAEHQELFPSGIDQGYRLHDILPESKKLENIRLRRIQLKSDEEVFTIAPCFILPYMMGYTGDVEKVLFLRQFGVPYWALTYVFGHNDMYWYRVETHPGRNSLVGTTVKDPDNLPEDLIADEKHSWENGDNIYIATTVAQGCVLGVSVASDADARSLTQAYSQFKTEAQHLRAQYEPKTVNTDGWAATKAAWQKLFSSITVILCFLHAFLNIRNRCKNMKAHFHEITNRVWEVYHSDKSAFMQKINELKKWARQTIPPSTGLEAILKLCSKGKEFEKAYDYPCAYRTSNMLDRIMDHQDRYLYSCRYFHGHRLSSEYSVRAWALLYNFHPYCPRSRVALHYISPAHKLNGFVYRENWLENLLVSASMGGFRK